MKLTSIGLIARGLIVVATSVMAANNTLQQVQAALAGLFFRSQGLPLRDARSRAPALCPERCVQRPA